MLRAVLVLEVAVGGLRWFYLLFLHYYSEILLSKYDIGENISEKDALFDSSSALFSFWPYFLNFSQVRLLLRECLSSRFQSFSLKEGKTVLDNLDNFWIDNKFLFRQSEFFTRTVRMFQRICLKIFELKLLLILLS